ncbi:MAG: uracil-DNA glycosylase [Candidatus Omnitrophica bacterium]|nr:uracil-DNA glycosylase [Candidatus Omnitrophota bacterium]
MNERRILKQSRDVEAYFAGPFHPDPSGIATQERPGTTDVAANGWESLEADALACGACALAQTRRNVVLGEGSRAAELMFVGEAPGFDEDAQGRPFVGKAGQLLDRIIEAMGFRRKDVYIANCLKCHPPQNRNPLPEEIAVCRHLLDRQVDLVQPRVVCALGKFAAQTLLGSDEPISRLRGRFFEYRGRRLIATFHPAYLLRNPSDKKIVWSDMRMILAELGRTPPARK